jgi:hypothetical protein
LLTVAFVRKIISVIQNDSTASHATSIAVKIAGKNFGMANLPLCADK